MLYENIFLKPKQFIEAFNKNKDKKSSTNRTGFFSHLQEYVE